VGVITYSDNAQVEFYLDSYSDRRDVLNALSFMQRGGRTNTQEALRLSNEDIFTASRFVFSFQKRKLNEMLMNLMVCRGDRTGVDDVAILLTDGGSNISKDRTIPRARDLKNNQVEVFVVAVGDQVSHLGGIREQNTHFKP
jgi:hypothetical protein